jgi:hypothetical protein
MTPRGVIQAEIEAPFKRQVKVEKVDGRQPFIRGGWMKMCCTLAKPSLTENLKYQDI